MKERLHFYYNRLQEHLWVKPLLICLVSIAAAFIASIADHISFLSVVPEIDFDSLEILLGIISASMLGISVFAVGSMISAYASASNTATPRAFPLIIADDVSQNALSSFIGAFIYSIVALVALRNGYYGTAGRFVLFLITAAVFALIIINFLRWLDRIARLGRMGNTIQKVEHVTAQALQIRKQAPTYGANKAVKSGVGVAVFADKIGYVQLLDVQKLQAISQKHNTKILVQSLPGTFIGPDQPLVTLDADHRIPQETIPIEAIREAFLIERDRTFDEDPRFGLVVLSQIASRALSPAVNDPGTAIDIIGSFVRLFTLWGTEEQNDGSAQIPYDRVEIPELPVEEMFDDAFNAIARDGAGTIEVVIRLLKALKSLATLDNEDIQKASVTHARLAYHYAKKSLQLPEELEHLENLYVTMIDS